jgi:hypothetical protein
MGGTVSPFHALHGSGIPTALSQQINIEKRNYAVRKTLDRLLAYWNRAYVVWGLSATLARMVGLRNPCCWISPSPARADYGDFCTLMIVSTLA